MFPWSVAANEAGLARGAIYLIRPDAYVAMANAEGTPRCLTEYFAPPRATLVRKRQP